MELKFTEAMMYEPIQGYLKEQGFHVQAEVKHCDIVAERDGHIIVIELKKSFSLKLVYQAMERQSRADEVYVAIPRPKKGQNTKEWCSMIKLLKKLDIGLITVAMDSPLLMVEEIFSPSASISKKHRIKQQRLLEEIQGRSGDYNVGGVRRKKIITAYREKSIELACILKKKGAVSYKELRSLGIPEKQIRMLYTNVYGWYQKVSKGCYTLSEVGKKELENPEIHKLVTFYCNKINGLS